MLKRNRRPTPPGVILKKYYMERRGLTVTRLATTTGLSRKHISKIVNSGAGISPEAAVRIAAVLDTTPALWLNLQGAVDLYDARKRLRLWRPREIVPPAAEA